MIAPHAIDRDGNRRAQSEYPGSVRLLDVPGWYADFPVIVATMPACVVRQPRLVTLLALYDVRRRELVVRTSESPPFAGVSAFG